MSVTDEQRKQIKGFAKQFSAQEIATTVGVSKRAVAGLMAARTKDFDTRVTLAKATEKWAVTMAKVGISRRGAHAPEPRWQFAIFYGPGFRESRGVVDLIAVRKDHRNPRPGLKLGDAFEIVLMQVKGGTAAKPTEEDGNRLRIVKRLYKARHVILATWKKGKEAKFYSLRSRATADAIRWKRDWKPVDDLRTVFGPPTSSVQRPGRPPKF